MKHIVKRHGREEHYESRKVYASVYAACRNAHLGEPRAEECAAGVAKAVDDWMGDRDETGSGEIFEKVAEEMAKFEPDAAFLYKTHRDVN